MATDPSDQIASSIVAFALESTFPEEAVSSLPLTPSSLPAAIKALADAKAKLQADIHAIHESTAPDVLAWKATAEQVQADILRSKALAAEIIKASETPVATGQAILEAEARAKFLVKELSYNSQVQEALKGVKRVNATLDEVEKARDERRIPEALRGLEQSWKELDAIPVSKSCRAVRLLDIRAFELKSDVHEVLEHVWNALVSVDVEAGKVSISSNREDEPMSLEDAVIGLKAYQEVDQRTAQLWRDIDAAVLAPRMDRDKINLPGIHTHNDVLELQGFAESSVGSLFADLEKVFAFLIQRLPSDLVETISSTLLPEVLHRVTTIWLDSAVPSSLQDMDRFQDVIQVTKEFCAALKSLGFSNLGDLQEWTENAPRVWLSKCREAALDSVRTRLSGGLGTTKQVEKIEKQMVSREEGKQLAANGANASIDDGWGAWDEGDDAEQETTAVGNDAKDGTAEEVAGAGEDDGADAWGWGDDDTRTEEKTEEEQMQPQEQPREQEVQDEDDPSDAWGWGDDAGNEEPEVESKLQPPATKPQPPAIPETREMILKETYRISSMPQPVLDLIFAIVEDGAALTHDDHSNSPVAAAAAGLFSLPTLALAMFRAVSPHYYAPGVGGNMYLYNDSLYLSERLSEFAAAWKKRTDISTRAQNMLRLDNDVKSLQSFANRAYANELAIQKTLLRDKLGGEQNLVQQPDPSTAVTDGVAYLRSIAAAWEEILSLSVWQQAVGSLVDAVASKIVADVMDLPAIGQDEAFNIAHLIASVTELDDLFLPSRWAKRAGGKGSLGAGSGEGEEVPTTAQYAASWLRLKYLSEVLQSNLKDVRYLWFESELSLYFSADEVVELIELSFEDNPRRREVVREVRGNPSPLEGS